MYLHKSIFYLVFCLFFIFPFTRAVRNKKLVVTKSGLADASACSIGLQFFSTINNTSDEDFIVELISDECCIHSGEAMDCDSLEIIGETVEVIRKGKVKTFKLVAPVLDPFERKGYCNIHLDSRPIDKRNLIMRDTIKIDFDTRLKNKMTPNSDESIKLCKNEDEDPLNDCKPVNCDTYYNGKKPIFDKIARKCVEVPQCKDKTSGDKEFFDPISNTCVDGEHIDIDDIDYIKSIAHNRHAKDVIIIESDDANPVSGNSSESNIVIAKEALAPTVLTKTLIPKQDGLYLENFLPDNKYSIIVLAMVFFSQCLIICTMIYCLTKRSADRAEKKVERKYFNYRQDASVTTPLITTSNIDTETAVCEFISESSNLDRKIQCYKACQKERNNDAKLSMSDDILSKCLNRRNWNPTAKSDTANNVHNLNNITNFEWHTNKDKQTVQEATIHEKVTSEHVAHEKGIESTVEVSQIDCGCRNIKEDYSDSDSSEKLIQCLDYNMIQGRNRSATEKFVMNQTAASIVSAEKGAQASFSKDSADDFLSERGMTFLAGDGLSKYSYTSDSTPKSSLLTSTSKTSKNNILKNVLSYLSKKSRILTASDPGMKKCKGKDLELIHMSQASMYSSSASEYRKLNKVKVARDSSTSF